MIKYAFFLILFFPLFAYASEELQLEHVISSVLSKYPLILAAEQEIARAQAAKLAALGEFDIKWKSGYSKVNEGYYPTDEVYSKLEKPTALWGLNVFGGYRRGVGDFATYDGKRETNSAGELNAGLSLPILRGREIDLARAGLAKADIDVDLADTEMELKKIELVLKASDKYWSWVSAGLKVKIISSLYEIAKSRAEALEYKVTHGAIPLFDQKDNQKSLLQRKGQLIEAEQIFRQTAVGLSLYLRDSKGKMIVPTNTRVPSQIKLVQDFFDKNKKLLVKQAIKKRPEVLIIENQKMSIKLDRKVYDNQQLPELNVYSKIAKDLGSGKDSLQPAEFESGVTLDVPLQIRKAQGKEAEAEAKIKKLNQSLNYIRDSIENDINEALIALEAAKSQVLVVREELKYARELEQGERQRFDTGDSSILIVNLREIATADTAKKEIEALSNFQKTSAALKAIIGEY